MNHHPKSQYALVALFGLLSLLFLLRPSADIYAQSATLVGSEFVYGDGDSQAVALGDVDGDGDLDAMVANAGYNRLWLNRGDGTFEESEQFIGEGYHIDVQLGDLDGDGDLDALFADEYFDSSAFTIWINDGKGRFNFSNELEEDAEGRAVALADLNGDGAIDLLTSSTSFTPENADPDSITIWINQSRVEGNRAGTFKEEQSLDDRYSTAIATADLDGDGDLDAFTGGGGVMFPILINQGNQQQGTQGNFGGNGQDIVTPNLTDVALGDLDNDGDMDAFIANYSNGPDDLEGPNQVWLNAGGKQNNTSGTFGDSGQRLGNSDSRAVTLGDLNGDGFLDAYVTNNEEKNDKIWFNDGKGNFPNSQTIEAPFFGKAIALGDLDNDGDLDAFLANSNNQPNEVFFNVGMPKYVSNGDALGASASEGVALGDLDNDGDLDAFVANDAYGDIGASNKVWLNQGGRFADSGQSLGDGWSRAVALGDLDNDNDLDAFVANGSTGTNYIWINQGGNQSGEIGKFNRDEGIGEKTSYDVALGDFDGDGDLDAFVINDEDNSNKVWFNEDIDTTLDKIEFTPSNQVLVSAWSKAVAVGDLDGDSDLDAFIVHDHEPASIWFNNGSGTFTDSNQEIPLSDGHDVALGDLDGDGDLDAFLANGYPSQPNKVWFNNGDGEFEDGGQSLGSSSSVAVALGDVDGDRDLDAIVTNHDAINRVWLNDGNGYFIQGLSSVGSTNSHDIALGDLDGDGDVDIFAANTFGLPNAVWLNQSGGTSRFQVDVGGPLGDPTADAHFYTTPIVIDGRDIELPYTLYDPNRQPIRQVQAFYSLNGGGDWRPAIGNTEVSTELTTGYVASSSSSTSIPDSGSASTSLTLAVNPNDPPAQQIHELRLTMNIGHPNKEQLTASLSAGGKEIKLFDGQSLPSGDIIFSDRANQPVTLLSAPEPVTFSSSNVPIEIRSDELFTITSDIIVSDDDATNNNLGTVLNVDVINISGTHSYIGDLSFSLTSPEGTTVQFLQFSHCAAGGDFELGVSDEAASGQTPCPPTGNSYQPTNALASFVGQPIAGTWTLTVHDLYASDGGTLNGWGLSFGSMPIESDINRFRPIEPLSLLSGLPLATEITLEITDASTGNSGSITSWSIESLGADHRFVWDTFESDVFGRSDNVVLRFEASPQGKHITSTNTYEYTNAIAGTSMWPQAASSSIPFRVQASQARVLQQAGTSTEPANNAIVFHLLNDETSSADPLTNSAGVIFQTGDNGYLPGRAEIRPGDRLMALLPVDVASDEDTSCVLVDNSQSETILSEGPNTVKSTISIPDKLEITEFDFIGIAGTHSYVGDLAISLTSPDGTTVDIMNPGCGGEQNFDFTLSSDSTYTETIDSVCPRDDGETYQPSNSLFEFHGERADGEWILTIEDRASDDGGELQNWQMQMCGVPLQKFDLYYTNGVASETGVTLPPIEEAGVQELVVSPENPLLLFNLAISLEWDARKDKAFLDQLVFDLNRTSSIIYDITNGQAALGDIEIFHNKELWNEADIRIYASNALVPNAEVGGILEIDSSEVITTNPFIEATGPYTVSYQSGFVRMGAVWNRFGEASGTIGEDWPRTLAHELGHYLFYLYDNYIGLDANGVVQSTNRCTGTLMTDQYRDDYTEFRTGDSWNSDCNMTISAQRTGRSDWDTIVKFYPWLKKPGPNRDGLEGPALLPINVTQVNVMDLDKELNTLEVNIFSMTNSTGGSTLTGLNANAVLYQDDDEDGDYDTIIDLGRPNLDSVTVWGAKPGDRLCVYEPTATRLGCEQIEGGDTYLALASKPEWQPEILVTPVSSVTIHISVTQVAAGLDLQAKLYPDIDLATEPIGLIYDEASQTYFGTLELEGAATEGVIQVWVANEPNEELTPRREAITSYALGGNPGRKRRRGCRRCRGRGGPRLVVSAAGAVDSPHGLSEQTDTNSSEVNNIIPAISKDGQVLLYANLSFDDGEFFALQKATRLPEPEAWKTVVGDGYYLLASANAPSLSDAAVNFRYRGEDVPPGEEAFLKLHFWNSSTQRWDELETSRNLEFNEASAKSRGKGLYALMSSVEIQLTGSGWNNFAYAIQERRPVTEALASIEGSYSMLWGYDTNSPLPWRLYGADVPPWLNDLTELEFGKGYWIHITEEGETVLKLKGANSSVTAAGFHNGIIPPAVVYGLVHGNDDFHPVQGQRVTAWIDGQLCGEGNVQSVESQLVYSLRVNAESGSSIGCGARGRTIHFQVDGRDIASAARWDNTQIAELPLIESYDYQIFVPVFE